VNHKRVLRLMREDNLLCLRTRPFVPMTTDSRHECCVVPNLARGMVPTGLDRLWVVDITYVRLLEEFAFLAVLLDAFSRRVISWALETHLRVSLTLTALEMAIKARRPAPGSLNHHSDRGVQYACREYTAVLAAHEIQPSMSRSGPNRESQTARKSACTPGFLAKSITCSGKIIAIDQSLPNSSRATTLAAPPREDSSESRKDAQSSSTVLGGILKLLLI
jgi:hypothetical protein